jgi:hypothetical protein
LIAADSGSAAFFWLDAHWFALRRTPVNGLFISVGSVHWVPFCLPAVEAVGSLRDGISAGWHWADELKEPDFEALRGQADLPNLLNQGPVRSCVVCRSN